MKKISWKRWIAALMVLSVGCAVCIVTDNVYFFFAGLAVFFVILVAAFIG